METKLAKRPTVRSVRSKVFMAFSNCSKLSINELISKVRLLGYIYYKCSSMTTFISKIPR
jgi:hypothetical protein